MLIITFNTFFLLKKCFIGISQKADWIIDPRSSMCACLNVRVCMWATDGQRMERWMDLNVGMCVPVWVSFTSYSQGSLVGRLVGRKVIDRYQVDQQARLGPDLRNKTYFGSLSTWSRVCLNLEMTDIYRVGILLPAACASSTINKI